MGEITWDSEKPVDTIVKHISYQRLHLVKEVLEYLGLDFGDVNVDNLINYTQNDLISLNENNHTVDDGIINTYAENTAFDIPESIKKYINDAIDAGDVSNNYLPINISTEIWENGEQIFKMWKSTGLPIYSCFALVGGTWCESAWRLNTANTQEMSGGGVSGTGGWAGCGEGPFGLTLWYQKQKIINALHPTTSKGAISNIESIYNSPFSAHLTDMDEHGWGKVSKYYIQKMLGSTYWDLLLKGSKEQKLCVSFLFKSGVGKNPTFDLDNVKHRVNAYKNTHSSLGISNVQDLFAKQILSAMLFADYHKHSKSNKNYIPKFPSWVHQKK